MAEPSISLIPEISYIVVCYNSERYISRCINSILNQSHTNYEIIIIDNSSKDNTISIVQNLCSANKKIRLISNTSNVGYGNAISTTLANAQGEFLAIMNADTFLDSNWASNLLKIFSADEKVMSASGKILFPNGELQSTGGIMDKYGAVIQRESKIFYSRKINDLSTFFYNHGSTFMIRKKVFQEIWFDQKLFLYYEDVDLAWKIIMLDYKIGYAENAISYHDEGHSSSGMTPFKFYYITRNRLYICLKNYSKQNIIFRVPIALLLTFFNSIFYATSEKSIDYIGNFLKAVVWNLFNIRLIIREHKRLRLKNKISDNVLDSHLLKISIELSLIKRRP
ncbi:MAG: glycosyltransferase family 2 protein [Nitrosopumilaceae archaeon]